MTPPHSGYRAIALSKGYFTVVSPHRYEELNKFTWSVSENKATGSLYAVRQQKGEDGKIHMISMHRQIMGLKFGDKRRVDHVDPNRTLNNTDENLRIVTHGQNMMNRRIGRHNRTGFKGVYYSKRANRYYAHIGKGGVQYYLGCFASAEDAALVVQQARLALHGEFARDY
jgi:hypothetical protein